MKLIIFIIFLTITGCSSKADDYIDANAPKENELFSLSAEEWKQIVDLLKQKSPKPRSFIGMENEDKLVKSVDYFKTYKNWFALIISLKNDSIGTFNRYVGYYDNTYGMIFYKLYGAELINYMDKEKIRDYQNLIEKDSLWSLYDEYGFWESYKTFYELFNRSALKISDKGIESYQGYSIPFRFNDAEKYEASKVTPELCIFLTLAVSKALDSQSAFQDEKYSDFDVTQEYFLNESHYFVLILSKRNDSIGAFYIVTGKILDDLNRVQYKILNENKTDLSGNRMKNYLQHLDNQTLWKIFANENVWLRDKTVKYIYESTTSEIKQLEIFENKDK